MRSAPTRAPSTARRRSRTPPPSRGGVIASIYDGINLMGLAMQMAHSTSGPAYNADIARIAAGTPDAVAVASYATGLAALKAGRHIHYVGVGGPIHFNAFHNSPGDFSASGFTASGGPTL